MFTKETNTFTEDSVTENILQVNFVVNEVQYEAKFTKEKIHSESATEKVNLENDCLDNMESPANDINEKSEDYTKYVINLKTGNKQVSLSKEEKDGSAVFDKVGEGVKDEEIPVFTAVWMKEGAEIIANQQGEVEVDGQFFQILDHFLGTPALDD